MKIFLDTADIAEIRRAAEAGLIDGVTTNPSLMAKVGATREPADLFLEICEAVDGPVSAEVVVLDAEGMIEQGHRLAKIHDNIVIKVPLTEAGLRACSALTNEGIHVNVTLCFSPTQAHLAAKAGATYISPFIGRIDDMAGDGMELVGQIRQIYDNYEIDTEILAASIRHPQHMVQALLLGADCGTLPPKVLYQLLEHPLTDKGLEGFMADWKSLGREL
ncbi:MAG TPA: fructose-6-phosphate aldolase [Gemmatimonadetes bacterium]|uniref:transaldolase n=1 Tax=marine metagenome TaxID=408172 RepID=A0A381NEP0_9ZZZZ|nr:fructose-6-phosphate aldolase [Gemmatimonadota bacterium]|tara:strand:+ start:112 stop:768 length:657 start_codon:yes stop_codon:yes gene_type:complete